MSDKKRRIVLITGGTKGIGLAMALCFARHGDQCIMTYGWGSVEEEDIYALFDINQLPAPYLKQADVINAEDTKELLTEIKEKYGKVDIFISNVSFSNLVKSIDDYAEKALLKSIEYSTWPMVEYTKHIRKIMGTYPKYVIGLSSFGHHKFISNYDFAAVTKSVMEVLVKYLNYHFFDKGVIYNVVRTRTILTDSLVSTVGKEYIDFMKKYNVDGTTVYPEEVANTVYMLCSGLMDGIRGETIIADKGYNYAEGFEWIYHNKMYK